MSEVDTLQIKGAPRRRHAAELKARVLAACDEPGASVAAIARAHDLNANLVHKLRRGVEPPASSGAGHVAGEFIALALRTRGSRRCRLEPFKKLARTITERAEAVVRGRIDNRFNAFVEAMNGLLQQAKRAARGFRTATNFIAIAYLRMSELKHLPAHPFAPATAK